jgi:hypothetical protein
MPFGLSNAPATFQALINELLRPFLCGFILVFFNDILIYSSSWAEHLQHMCLILDTLQQHRLFMKRSKCEFGCSEVVCLSHVISGAGVAMDQQKFQAILGWPTPGFVRVVHSFLGLVGYYRWFIHDFGTITAPLTKILHKGIFQWCPDAENAFCALQHALTTMSVLQLPDFDKLFMVECDVSSSGLGVVLHQGTGPVTFFSRPIVVHHAKLTAYERELIGLVQAVRH